MPTFFDPESREWKPIPPEELAEAERDLGKDSSRTIRVKRDATFADLFDAEEKLANKIQESGKEEDDPAHFAVELETNFDEPIPEELRHFRAVLEAMRAKRPEEYTEEEKRLIGLKMIDYFQEKGHSMKDIEALLPIKFKKEKKKKSS